MLKKCNDKLRRNSSVLKLRFPDGALKERHIPGHRDELCFEHFSAVVGVFTNNKPSRGYSK